MLIDLLWAATWPRGQSFAFNALFSCTQATVGLSIMCKYMLPIRVLTGLVHRCNMARKKG